MSGFGYPADADADPSVCYRHPDRQSWVLCQRCGRTICPECQIQAPVGVQCPECVREAGGSVRWTPTAIAGGKAPRDGGRRRTRRSNAGRTFTTFFASGSGPHLSWIIAGASLVLWLAGFFTGSLPYLLLAAFDGMPAWQVWRYFTSWAANPSIPDGGSILLFLFNMALFAWFGPFIEGLIGRARFALVFLTAAVFGSAVGVLAGGAASGLTPGLYGVFVVYGISAMRSGSNPIILWVLMGFNILYTAVAYTAGLPQLIGGLLAGVGMWWLLERRGSSRNANAPYLAAGGGVAVMIVLATLRLVAFG